MPYNKPIYIYVNTYKEARITAIHLFQNNGCNTNVYAITKEEWGNSTPLYVEAYQHDFIIDKVRKIK